MHAILIDDSLVGWEYGMLRCLEREIIRQTGAIQVKLPAPGVARRAGHGTRHAWMRKFMKKPRLELPDNVDVLWSILMGPENYQLDLFKGWKGTSKAKVVYIFDTLPHQFPLIRKSFSEGAWDILVTSFDDAVPRLERSTGRKWNFVDQAVSMGDFKSAPFSDRLIAFSAYGRRDENVHKATMKFCREQGLYYDFMTHDRSQPSADPTTLYRQYAWHLTHSVFTFSWPVEHTNPMRSGEMSPITCRWFEGAASGAAIVGKAPRNPHFREIFGDDFVVTLDVDRPVDHIVGQLGEIWSHRRLLSERADTLRHRLGRSLDWSARVETIRKLLP